MRAWSMALLLLVAPLGAPQARAQVSVDVAKITCRQLLFDKVISPNTKSLALWLSGYYNGKRGNTVLDIGELAKNTDKVEDYCRMNQDVTVMDAVTKALSPSQ
ncbi:MAG: HdeA/HdeB family chaperone [Xanthobacteraceae bacterium]